MDKAFILWRYYDHRGWYPGFQTNSLIGAVIAYLDGKVKGETVTLCLNLSKFLN